MNGLLGLIGLWIEVIGQITSATAETKGLVDEGEHLLLLVVIGEGLQSVGEALQGLGEEDPVMSVGSYIESAGAGLGSYAAWKQLVEDGEEFLKLEIVGDSLQGLGAAYSAELEDNPILSFGDRLESLGATLEAVGGVIYMQGEEDKGQQLFFLGSWLQVLGGLTSATYLSLRAAREGE